MDASVTESAGQLAALESQLTSAKAQYQTETKLVADLQTRQREQLSNITKTRGELVTAESDLSALRAEKAEIEGSVLRDKEDIRDLQRNLKEMGEQTTFTKAEVEKLKRDARQQKGLLAIAKKQLATAEENAEKARKEASAEQEELARIQEDIDRTNAATEALASATKAALTPGADDSIASVVPTPDPAAFPASVPLPETPEVPSPAILAKSNNPFGRLTRQNSTASTTASPTAFKPFALPTPVEVGSETPTTEAALLAPLPPSTDDIAKSDDPFNTAFGIEEPAEVNDTPKILATEATPPPPAPRLSATPPAAENTESFVIPPSDVPVSSTGVSAPIFEEPPSSENHDGVHTLPQAQAQSEPQLVESIDRQQDEDSSDDGAVEPEDAFGSKPPRPNQASVPGAFENDVFRESPFTPTSVVKTSTEQEGNAQTAGNPISPSPNIAFNDAFGLSEPTADAAPAGSPSVPPVTSPFTALPPPPSARNGRSSPASQPSTAFDDSPFSAARFPSLNDTSRPASTAELDAAFGGKPTLSDTVSNGASEPIFQRSFDDAFDFGSASTSNLPVAKPTLLTNGHTTVITNEPSTWLSAAPRPDETPVTTAAQKPAYNPPPALPPRTTEATFSFGDAFGAPREILAFTTIPAPAPVPVPPPVVPVGAPAPRPVLRPNPLSDDEEDNRPLSQSIDRAKRRSISPPIMRSRMSPPPAAKSSGKGQPAKDDGGSKSSKLSLHFPFGKNKKNKDKAGTGSSKKSGTALPDSPSIDEHGSYRAPPPITSSQRPRRASQVPPAGQDVIGSGGPDDDIAAVRTLVNMGFTRQQAVDALEQNSYDVPAALNKLLGTA
jgi:epidermal growth factor receptor substrate 15